MAQYFKKPIPVENLPAGQVVELYDINTDTVVRIPVERHKRLSNAKKTALGRMNEYVRRYYSLSEHGGGQKIVLYHLVAQRQVSVMTLNLLQEIQRRNPNETWKRYITTVEEAESLSTVAQEAASTPDIAAVVAAEVQKALKASTGEGSEAPRRGRRKKKE